ncbi:MAG: hypothetical protein AAGA77_12835 [Bacteroidota bacterium]
MKFFYLLLLAGLLIYSSCNSECQHIDCISPLPTMYLSVVSNVDSTDLLFGDQSRYDIEEVRFFEIDGADTIDYSFIEETLLTSESMQVLYFDAINSNSSELFLQLDESDIDTFSVTYSIQEAECCGTIKQFNTIHHNGRLVLDLMSVNDWITVIEK